MVAGTSMCSVMSFTTPGVTRTGLHETDPECELLVTVVFEKSLRLRHLERRPHIGVVTRIGELVAVEPDARWIPKGPPGKWFRRDARRNRGGLYAVLPFASQH